MAYPEKKGLREQWSEKSPLIDPLNLKHSSRLLSKLSLKFLGVSHVLTTLAVSGE